MLTVGDRFPEYDLPALVAGNLGEIQATSPDDYFIRVTGRDHPGRWRVVFFWPKDFTFVCPTEIAEFGRKAAQFAASGAEVLGVSTDSEFVHYAWRNQLPVLRDLPIPMAADLRHDLTDALGVLTEEGVAMRATFLVDPDGIIQFAMVTAGAIGRNVDEVLRVLEALQTGELTPCAWTPGQKTIDAAAEMAGS